MCVCPYPGRKNSEGDHLCGSALDVKVSQRVGREVMMMTNSLPPSGKTFSYIAVRMRFQRTAGVVGGSGNGGGKSRQVVERWERRIEVSCQVRPQPQILDTEIRRMCRTSEEMLGGVSFPAVTFRAGG